MPKTLSRPLWDKKIGGVCAGFARYMDVDVTLMRIIWLVTAIFTGIGFVAYLIAWIAMPAEATLRLPSNPFRPGSASPESTPNPPEGALGQTF
ncbi:MAG: PspC domain-containing protein [Bryobacterales bacterium]|nr:PspC domain-containing protein [Bryobacterales bacterium]